jgi:hypothetical protein
MARAIQTDTEAVNADSFLDIVASVVSIMIVMVLAAGLRIKNAPVDVPLEGAAAEARAELARDAATEQSIHGDIQRTAGQIEHVAVEASIRGEQRDALALAVARGKQFLDEKRRGLDAQAGQDFDASRRLAEARGRLEELERHKAAAETTPGEVVQIESYPTPLSKTSDGPEIWFFLQHGRVAFVPHESLLEKFKEDAQKKVFRLRDQDEFSDSLQSENGFRLEYTLERHEVTQQEAMQTGRSGTTLRVKHITITPLSDRMGESADEALAPNSQFRMALSEKRRAQGTIVTVFTYPDSFAAFRQLKKQLHQMGYTVAAWPLPDGEPIGMSPDGFKSAAQ